MTGIVRGYQPPIYRILDIGDGLTTITSLGATYLRDEDHCIQQVLNARLGSSYAFIAAIVHWSRAAHWVRNHPGFSLTPFYKSIAQPLLEPTTGLRVDLALYHTGTADASFNLIFPNPSAQEFHDDVMELVAKLYADGVKKTLVLTPPLNPLGSNDEQDRLREYAQALLSSTETPPGTEVLNLYPLTNETHFANPVIFPTQAGHAVLRPAVQRQIERGVHKRLRYPVGTTPFYRGLLGPVNYPPTWNLS